MPSLRHPRRPVDWKFTRKVREALREERYILSEHVQGKLPALGLTEEGFLESVAAGIVLARRERDEAGTATDGYKHFLEAVSAGGAIIEVVLKFVPARSWPGEELMITITAYRGKA